MSIIEKIANAFKTLKYMVTSDSSVKEANTESLKEAVLDAVQDGSMNAKEAEELMESYRVSFVERVKVFSKRIDDSVRLDSEDKGNKTISETKEISPNTITNNAKASVRRTEISRDD